MPKRPALFGLLIGLALIGGALVALPLATAAREDVSASPACPSVEVALDVGYGVTRTAFQRSCARDR